MPENERQPAPDRLSSWRPGGPVDLDASLGILAGGDLVVEGRLPWSSNLTFLVTATGDGDVDGSRTVRGVYKPGQGERPLWDFPDRLYRREVAAWVLAEACGWPLVPPTVEREEGPFGPGSVQLFIDADYEEHYFTLYEAGGHDDVLRVLCAFDVVANNADRKGGHVLRGTDGRLWAIDHGVCFHREPKLRTVLWDYAGEEVPAGVLATLAGVGADLPVELEDLLSGAECQAVVDRIDDLVARGTYPHPVDDLHPPYPWPLV